ncbi:MAG TPA: 50S ribosomal protein L6 [Kiritimatiellae bacterium]|nr:50S ribosomal protein L6 [Kiritimatiellia bacterium]
MSRIGRLPVPVPAGVTVEVADTLVRVEGPKGTLSYRVPPEVTARVEGNSVIVERRGESKRHRAMHGTARSVIANMVKGVGTGYRRELEIQGVGYRAEMRGRKLVLSLGYSHLVEYDVPDGVEVEVADQAKIVVSGPDKVLVGNVAARIRSFYVVEPYKGKGIRYRDEHVRRKAGKAVG